MAPAPHHLKVESHLLLIGKLKTYTSKKPAKQNGNSVQATSTSTSVHWRWWDVVDSSDKYADDVAPVWVRWGGDSVLCITIRRWELFIGNYDVVQMCTRTRRDYEVHENNHCSSSPLCLGCTSFPPWLSCSGHFLSVCNDEMSEAERVSGEVISAELVLVLLPVTILHSIILFSCSFLPVCSYLNPVT